MDDRDSLRAATECGPRDSDMSNTHEIATSGIQLRVDFDRTPSFGEGDAPAFAGGAPAGAGEEPVCAEDASAAEQAATARIIEALLFSSDAPLSATRLAELVESTTPAAVRRHIAALNDKYERAGLSFRIEAIARGYQMMTLPDFSAWIAKLNKQRSETRLSAAALEALSIVAYKQPIIRADVEAIRGVACGEVLSRLRELGLIRVLGRAEIVGRPLLYGTTRRFLDVFGLADIEDLPPMEALTLKSATKPAEEVEPVKPPPIVEPQQAQFALTGA